MLVLVASLGDGVATASRTIGTPETVLTSHLSRLGWQLVVKMNGQKLSLYVLTTEGRKSTCYESCTKVWIPLLARGQIEVANRSCHSSACHINRKRLRTVRRNGGLLQVTYYNHPLYRYYKDTKSGQTKGQDKDGFGGPWAAIDVDGRWSCLGLGCGY